MANWANLEIDKWAPGVVEDLLRLVQGVATSPVAWTLAVAVILLVGLFLHSYCSERAAVARTNSEPPVVERSDPRSAAPSPRPSPPALPLTYFADRAVLDRESPLADKFEKVTNIHALWLTGAKALQEIPAVTKVQRLLLPNPHSTSIKYYQAALPDSDKRDIAQEIIRSTEQARQKGIPVRWLSEYIGYTLTIWDPHNSTASAHIQFGLPAIHGSNQPSFEFNRSQHAFFDHIVTMFDRLWTQYSVKPILAVGEFSAVSNDD